MTGAMHRGVHHLVSLDARRSYVGSKCPRVAKGLDLKTEPSLRLQTGDNAGDAHRCASTFAMRTGVMLPT